MDANLIIDDEYVHAVGDLCKTKGEELEKLLDSYVQILSEIENEAISKGEISNTLTIYKGYVKKLNDGLSFVSSNVNAVCSGFITDINTADDYLF